jgi:sterol 3beta-glucosyltransferase
VANERVESEEEQGIREERVEMQRADEQRPEDATPMARSPSEEKALQIPKPDDRNALASLRQDSAESGNTVQTVSGAGKKRSPEEKQDAKKRRAERLAVKLKEVFGLPEAEELLVEMPCWLLRNLREPFCHIRSSWTATDGLFDRFAVIVLQGYMYLTTSHICFFARMPEAEVSRA